MIIINILGKNNVKCLTNIFNSFIIKASVEEKGSCETFPREIESFPKHDGHVLFWQQWMHEIASSEAHSRKCRLIQQSSGKYSVRGDTERA